MRKCRNFGGREPLNELNVGSSSLPRHQNSRSPPGSNCLQPIKQSNKRTRMQGNPLQSRHESDNFSFTSTEWTNQIKVEKVHIVIAKQGSASLLTCSWPMGIRCRFIPWAWPGVVKRFAVWTIFCLDRSFTSTLYLLPGKWRLVRPRPVAYPERRITSPDSLQYRQNDIYLYARKTDPIECFRNPLPWLRPHGTVRTFWTNSWHFAIREALREMSSLESHTIISRESISRYLLAQKSEEASVSPRTTSPPLGRVQAMRAGLEKTDLKSWMVQPWNTNN